MPTFSDIRIYVIRANAIMHFRIRIELLITFIFNITKKACISYHSPAMVAPLPPSVKRLCMGSISAQNTALLYTHETSDENIEGLKSSSFPKDLSDTDEYHT